MVFPLPYGSYDGLPLPYGSYDGLPLPYGSYDGLPLPYGSYDGLPLPYGSYDGLPLPYGSYDGLPLPYGSYDGLPLPYGSYDGLSLYPIYGYIHYQWPALLCLILLSSPPALLSYSFGYYPSSSCLVDMMNLYQYCVSARALHEWTVHSLHIAPAVTSISL